METKTTFYMTIIYPSKNKNIQCLCFRAEKCVGNFEVFLYSRNTVYTKTVVDESRQKHTLFCTHVYPLLAKVIVPNARRKISSSKRNPLSHCFL